MMLYNSIFKSKIFTKVAAIILVFSLSLSLAACSSFRKNPEGLNEIAENEISDNSSETVAENDVSDGTESLSGSHEEEVENPDVILADERMDAYLPELEGKRVALFTNQTGIVGDDLEKNQHILDALLEQEINVTCVFCPEHGFRGDADAGAAIVDDKDAKTGTPIYSLYGTGSNYPSSDQMDAFDILVVDIQDVGLRYYTYYITMFYLMEACASEDKEVLILDRPNPNGFYVDGPVLKEEYKSGVGILPIPVVHGMTLGELALMINQEGWLKTGAYSCDVRVVTCVNYTHDTKYEVAINPSPNLKSMKAIYLYASTCCFENTVVSAGRGTDHPFETFGSPYLEGADGYGYEFIPESMAGAVHPTFEGKICYGKDLSGLSDSEIFSEGINISYLVDAYNAVKKNHPDVDFFGTPDSKGIYWIDKLFGDSSVRVMTIGGYSAEEIEDYWQHDLEEFKKLRSMYLLYDDYTGGSEEVIALFEKENSEGAIVKTTTLPNAQWQVDVSFPEWRGFADDTLALNDIMGFDFYSGQGKMYLEVAESVTGFDMYINGNLIDTKEMVGGSTYEVDFSGLSVNGRNTVQISNVTPFDAEETTVRVCIPYPTVIKGKPEDVGISSKSLDLISTIVEADVANGFTSSQLAIIRNGRLVYQNAWGYDNTYLPDGSKNPNAKPVNNNTMYDLASVTKMAAVNLPIQKLVTDGVISLDDKICDLVGEGFYDNVIDLSYKGWENPGIETQKEWKKSLTVRDVLCHQAGFPADPKYYIEHCDASTWNLGNKYTNVLFAGNGADEATKEKTFEAICKTPLMYEPGTKTVYSDVDYMLLGFVIEKVTGKDLDTYLKETFCEPMGLSEITYNPTLKGYVDVYGENPCAATELSGNTRDGVVNFDGIRDYTLKGEVHDEKAYYSMGGISGHAGLFANATGLAILFSTMLTGGYGENSFYSKNVIDTFTAPKSMGAANWGLGWWREGEFQRVGFFGTSSNNNAYGHQGWTGTIVIIDPDKDLVIVYLTNKINSRLISRSNTSRFRGGAYTSATLGFVPQILSVGMDSDIDPTDQLTSLMASMARESFELIPEDAEEDNPYYDNARSKVMAFNSWCNRVGVGKDDRRYIEVNSLSFEE
jgi:uncharacterized protein YbbC (DUF1343 family)/CubicO group peptidase (beta-lactamase class C family)